MTEPTIIEQIKARDVEVQHAYGRLVQRIHTGNPVQPEEASAILAAAHKTADDLQADLDRLKRIGELQKIIKEEGPKIKAAEKALQERRQREAAELKKTMHDWKLANTASDCHYTTETNRIRAEQMKLGALQTELDALLTPPKPESKPEPKPEQEPVSCPFGTRYTEGERGWDSEDSPSLASKDGVGRGIGA